MTTYQTRVTIIYPLTPSAIVTFEAVKRDQNPLVTDAGARAYPCRIRGIVGAVGRFAFLSRITVP